MKRGQRLSYRVSFEYPNGVNGKAPAPEGLWQALNETVGLLSRGAEADIQKRQDDGSWATLRHVTRDDIEEMDELENYLLDSSRHDDPRVAAAERTLTLG
jgi:hypothetical protein